MMITTLSSWDDSEILRPRQRKKHDPVIRVEQHVVIVVSGAPSGDFRLFALFQDWKALWEHCFRAEQETGNALWLEVPSALAHYSEVAVPT